MVRSRQSLLFFLSVLLLVSLATGTAGAVDEFIEINPFIKKIPLAIPDFKPLAAGEDSREVADSAAQLLADTLQFTGYFNILDQGAFLEDPRASGISEASINFRSWTVIGAELLITGGVRRTPDAVEMELRLFDTFKGQSVLGKRYRGTPKDTRRIVRRFAGEVIFFLTGTHGFFNSEIAFVSTQTGNKEIYICEFDGHNPVQFTRTRDITLSPAWSPDGQWLAYTAYPKNRPFLYIKHRFQKRGYEIGNKGLNITPAWMPANDPSTSLDNLRLAATLSFTGDQEIYLLTGKGKIIKRLTKSWGSDVSPTWSPDGKKVAFVSNRSGNPQIYVKDLDSGRVDRLTYQGRYNTQPNWSPKGGKLAYAAMQGSRNDIYVIGFNGRPPVQLTREAGNNESPSWSPDGSMIVFSSTREGRPQIYVMTAFGTDQRRLLTMPGEQTNPQWSPNKHLN